MIVQGFWDATSGVLAWIASLMPSIDLPSWFTGAPATLGSFLDGFDGLGVWAPWGLVAAAVALATAVWLACGGVKLVRAVVSYVPFFGGAG